MPNKIVISTEILKEIAERLNSKELTIGAAAKEYGCSTKSIQRKLKETGYLYNRVTAQYEFKEPEGNLKVKKMNNTTTKEKHVREPLNELQGHIKDNSIIGQAKKETKGVKKEVKENIIKPGRPVKPNKEKTTINLNSDIKLRLQVYCLNNKINLGDLLEQLGADFLNKEK